MHTILCINNLCFSYKKSAVPALKNIDLEIKEGEFFGLIGPNGAGKSTLCCCLNGLIPQSIRGKYSGEVTLFGNKVSTTPVHEITSLASMIFQDFESQLFSTNVKLEMAFGPENLGIPPETIDTLVRENIIKIGLAGMETRQPACLSGGQKQRLAIGSVLTIDTKLLILDEPTTDLDPVGKEDIFRILEQLRNEKKRTY